MSTTATQSIPPDCNAEDSFLAGRLSRALQGRRADRVWELLLLINIVMLFARPQNDIPFLSTIELPFLLSFPLALLSLFRLRESLTPQTKAMILLVIFGAFWVPFARNNFWAFHRVRSLAILFGCFILPLVILCSNARSLRRLTKVLFGVACYLSLYSLSHSGSGPGDFLGDENDFALILTLLLPFPLLMLPVVRSGRGRLFLFALSGALVAGTVATESRGGFIGLAVAFLYILLKSPAKLLIGSGLFIIALGGIVLAPPEYWDEVRSIQYTNAGTAKSRREIWAVARRIWLDFERPSHIFFGVGMGNSPYWLRDYEPPENYTSSGRSIAGRAIHSVYFEMLSDTGLLGFSLFLTVVLTSYWGNTRLILRSRKLIAAIDSSVASSHTRSKTFEQISGARGEQRRDVSGTLLRVAARELEHTTALAHSLNAAWPVILTSGAFISIFYYPLIWFIGGVSAAVQVFHRSLEQAIIPLLTRVSPEPSSEVFSILSNTGVPRERAEGNTNTRDTLPPLMKCGNVPEVAPFAVKRFYRLGPNSGVS